jgi:hypothetical protein
MQTKSQQLTLMTIFSILYVLRMSVIFQFGSFLMVVLVLVLTTSWSRAVGGGGGADGDIKNGKIFQLTIIFIGQLQN